MKSNNIDVTLLTDKERSLFFEGIALGQRMTGATMLEKFNLIESGMKFALMQLIMKEIKGYLDAILVMDKESVAKAFNK